MESCTLAASVTAVAKLRSVFVVVMFAPRLFAPVPFCVKAPVLVMAPVALFVNNPAFVIVVVPATTSALFTVSAAPVKAKLPVYVCAPEKAVVPVPASCVKLAASTVDEKVALAAEFTVRAPSGVTAPIVPATVIEPAPAASVSACAALLAIVDKNVMPPVALTVVVPPPAKLTASAAEKAPEPSSMTLPASDTAPVPASNDSERLVDEYAPVTAIAPAPPLMMLRGEVAAATPVSVMFPVCPAAPIV